MHRFIRFQPLPLVVVVFAAACASNTTPVTVPQNSTNVVAPRGASPDLKPPVLITLDETTGVLESWPIHAGGDQPKPISPPLGIFEGYGLVANGDVVAIANYSPPEIVTYDVKTKTTKTIADPYGNPVDIAIGKDRTMYALHTKSVSVFPAGSSQPSELTCNSITDGVAIAIDDESDI